MFCNSDPNKQRRRYRPFRSNCVPRATRVRQVLLNYDKEDSSHKYGGYCMDGDRIDQVHQARVASICLRIRWYRGTVLCVE